MKKYFFFLSGIEEKSVQEFNPLIDEEWSLKKKRGGGGKVSRSHKDDAFRATKYLKKRRGGRVSKRVVLLLRGNNEMHRDCA